MTQKGRFQLGRHSPFHIGQFKPRLTVFPDASTLRPLSQDGFGMLCKDATRWALLSNTIPMDFGARMYANETVPEPSVTSLAVVGGLGILGFAYRLRRKKQVRSAGI